jgi:hypothetical protein
MHDIPLLRFDPKDCLVERPLSFGYGPPSCANTGSPFELGREADYDRLIDSVREVTGAEIFDTTQFMKKDFPVSEDGMIMYRDTNHLTVAGSMFFTKYYDF